MEGDAQYRTGTCTLFYISIHALRVEGDENECWLYNAYYIFLSTPSVWRATFAPCVCYHIVTISIHALRVEGDSGLSCSFFFSSKFLSTPSVWRATKPLLSKLPHREISIHALRVEGDSVPSRPRSVSGKFLSTPSVWRATFDFDTVFFTQNISIHALRVEGDIVSSATSTGSPPQISIHALRVEGDPVVKKRAHNAAFISIHALRVEGDQPHGSVNKYGVISIHALRVEGDVFIHNLYWWIRKFLSTPSVWRATQTPACDLLLPTEFLSTPSVWRATAWSFIRWKPALNFYPRPPCGGRPAKVHKILFHFAAQTRKFVVLILQSILSLVLSKPFHVLLYHFSAVF